MLGGVGGVLGDCCGCWWALRVFRGSFGGAGGVLGYWGGSVGVLEGSVGVLGGVLGCWGVLRVVLGVLVHLAVLKVLCRF